MGINETGRVTLGGEVGIDPLGAKLGMKVSDLALGDFGPIVETFVPVVLESATLDFSGMATVEVGDGEVPEGRGGRRFACAEFLRTPVRGVGSLHGLHRVSRDRGGRCLRTPRGGDPRNRLGGPPDSRLNGGLMASLPCLISCPRRLPKKPRKTLEELAEATEEEIEAFVEDALADLPIQIALGRFVLR